MRAAEERKAAAEGRGCLGKAADDEPVFVLRAKDPAAPVVVRTWAELSDVTKTHESEKINEARALADHMVEWQKANGIYNPLAD